jgi:hypothetical protein
MTHSRYLLRTDNIDQYNIGGVVARDVKAAGMRGEWESVPMVTFRRSVIDAIPLQHLIEVRIQPESTDAQMRYYSVIECLSYSSL